MGADAKHPILYTIFGLNRAGQVLYFVLIAGAAFGFAYWKIEIPRRQFSAADEALFRAARHGDRAGVEQSLEAGGGVNDIAPIDGKTALFRAAVFSHVDVVRLLLERGADPERRGNDGQTALEAVQAARAEEKDPQAATALDAVAKVLHEAQR